MARVLLGWELGANRGHAVALIDMAHALIADGHEVTIAAQQPALFAGFDAAPVLQAPIWPGLLGATSMQNPVPAVSMGNILFDLGLSVPGAFASLIRAWSEMLSYVRPDVVIADYAPALSCAARGRIRTIALGNGFCQPPADMAVFPVILKLSKESAPEPLLDIINIELKAAGRAEVANAPAIFAADATVIACFAEFDPYRHWRTGDYALPHMSPLAPMAEEPGNEVFVYFYRADGSSTKLWNALAATGLKTRVFIAQAHRDNYPSLSGRGIIVEPTPVSWDLIAKRSRIVVSHGGLGFTSAALAMGLPHVVVPYDLEKIVTGLTVRKLGIGDCLMLKDAPDSVAGRLSTAYENKQLQDKVRSAAQVVSKRIDRHAGRHEVALVRMLVAEKVELAMQPIDGVLA